MRVVFGRNLPPIIWHGPILAAGTVIQASSAYAITPLDYLHGEGWKAYPVVYLTWGLLGISIAVIVIISALLLWGIWRRHGISGKRPGEPLEVARPEGGLRWIWIGVGVTSVVLLASVIWTIVVLFQVRMPAGKSRLTIEVTGHQWWWELRYLDDDPAKIFTTANEIHIPTGVPVHFKLKSDDVIHSFWVPALAGKMDAIPGLNNETWLEAQDAGVYRGQCTEFCGLQHANMGFLVIAETPQDFAAWRTHQVQPPVSMPDAHVQAGRVAFEARCASCHTIRGTNAQGVVGPDLSHLALRMMLASALLSNNPEHLRQWISDPQSIKPGSKMPKPAATPEEIEAIRAYLQSLH